LSCVYPVTMIFTAPVCSGTSITKAVSSNPWEMSVLL
jgi:hypothetical protein